MSLKKMLQRYDYDFPPELIAKEPASPRDAARLLVYRRAKKDIVHARFLDLPGQLPPGSVLVFNETKVVPARLVLRKPTGGKAVLLYVDRAGRDLRFMADRRLEIGSTLTLDARHHFKITGQQANFYLLRPLFPMARFPGLLERHGLTPLPPYIKDSPLTEAQAREKYQAVFAKRRGSVAAPTASLHFTGRLLAKLRRRGFDARFVTLHVGLGTFAPVTEDHWRRGRLHRERYEIDPATARFLERAKRQGRPIVAVGTTVVRTLESAADDRGRLRQLRGDTDLFIREGAKFRFVDALVTNFHVPRSSLLMLVSAFAGRREVRKLYRLAIAEKYRLFSFGDGMLIV
ncbi:MAG: tRNA preQ1(34) S-adenosylmethionine ribosyltransferase-isomerase QueA [Patescibacteria group bacterium]